MGAETVRASTPAPTVLCVGQATMDHVFAIAAPLRTGHKHVAHTCAPVGGGLAANAAVTVARLGGRSVLVAPIGDDATGDLVRSDLAAEGVDTRCVVQTPGTSTPMSTVIVGPDGERTIVNHTDPRVFGDAPPVLDDVTVDAVLVDGRWPEAGTAALHRARELGVCGVVDVDRPPTGDQLAAMLTLASHVVFGEDALLDVAGTDDPCAALSRIADTTDALVAVTCGERGVAWYEDGDLRRLPAIPVDAVDTTAAGDVFHGALALALAERAPTTLALRFASAAAALKCCRAGARTGIPRRDEVEELLARVDGAPHEHSQEHTRFGGRR